MRKGTIISIIALLISIVGLLVALIAYFKRRSCALCDDLDDDFMEEYYGEDEDCDCCCGENVEEIETEPEAEETAPAEEPQE